MVGEVHNIIVGAGWPPGGEGGRAGWRGDYLRVKGGEAQQHQVGLQVADQRGRSRNEQEEEAKWS